MSRPAGLVDGLLAGRYRLGALVGAGASGEVWSAHDERLARDVAVKVLRPELAGDATVRARFRAEAHHAGRLRHPGIAAVFDYAEDADGAWLVMELVDGRALSEVLRQEGRLPVDRTLDVVEQAAAALQAAHDDGVVHRDVKPGNLLLREDGRLSVTDFGIAHAAGAAALTRTGQVMGTAAYLSPEQAAGGPVSPATDLYALGVVAHECLSGSRPFERDDPVAVLLAHLHTAPPPLPPDVPRPVAALVHRLMAKDPADRPVSARQVQSEAAALRRASTDAAAATVAPTAVLPAPASAAALPALPARPARTAVLGLAGRPGQRRAVRLTAVALGLLAVALGVRDALVDDPDSPADVQPGWPASTAPAAPGTTPDPVAPQESQPVRAPVVVPEQEPEQPSQDEVPEPGDVQEELQEQRGKDREERGKERGERREDDRGEQGRGDRQGRGGGG